MKRHIHSYKPGFIRIVYGSSYVILVKSIKIYLVLKGAILRQSQYIYLIEIRFEELSNRKYALRYY